MSTLHNRPIVGVLLTDRKEMPLVEIPLKEPHPLEWNEQLQGYITKVYMDDPSKYRHEIDSLNQMRSNLSALTKDIKGRDMAYRYYGQLELLPLRFSFGEDGINCNFEW
jgi:hypothetical protein